MRVLIHRAYVEPVGQAGKMKNPRNPIEPNNNNHSLLYLLFGSCSKFPKWCIYIFLTI